MKFFIRSRKCFKLGWPMDRSAEFFVPSDEAPHSSMVINVLLYFDPKVMFMAYLIIIWEFWSSN